MVKDYYRDLRNALREKGWERLRSGKGSHEIWYAPITNRQVTLCHTTSIDTANKILRAAAMDKRF
jgi:YcfA-like protein.